LKFSLRFFLEERPPEPFSGKYFLNLIALVYNYTKNRKKTD